MPTPEENIAALELMREQNDAELLTHQQSLVDYGVYTSNTEARIAALENAELAIAAAIAALQPPA